MPAGTVEIYATNEMMMHAEARRIVTQARSAIAARRRFMIALAGGSTPRHLYEVLAQPLYATDIDWARVHVFWGDERCVPPDHAHSNYRMAREALLDNVPLPAANVHRIAGEDPPEAAARAYDHLLRSYFSGDRTFDRVLLGMGDDGHTASLFAGTPALTERERWVMATHVAHLQDSNRITLTPVVLNAAEVITFLVTGHAKARRLHDVLAGADVPAGRIRPTRGSITWLVDRDAAAELEGVS